MFVSEEVQGVVHRECATRPGRLGVGLIVEHIFEEVDGTEGGSVSEGSECETIRAMSCVVWSAYREEGTDGLRGGPIGTNIPRRIRK